MTFSAWFLNGADAACTKHLSRLSRRLGGGAEPQLRVLETFPYPRTGPFKVRARGSVVRVQLCVGLGGGAEQSSSLARVPDVPQNVSRCFALFCLRLIPSALRRRREGSRAKPRSGRRSRPLSPRVLRRDDRKSRRSSVAEQGCAVGESRITNRAAHRGILR